jgi:hypothetical protein
MAIPQAQGHIAMARMAQQRFVYGLSKTPDDRLAWSPSPTAKTPLQAAGQVVGFVTFLTQIIASKALPPMTGGEQPAPPATREEATAALNATFDNLVAAMEAVKEEDLNIPIPAPWMPSTPMVLENWLGSTMSVTMYFQGQLNYIQTIYGDLDPNMPAYAGQA